MDWEFGSARNLDTAANRDGQFVRLGDLYEYSVWFAGILSDPRRDSAASAAGQSEGHGRCQFGGVELGGFYRRDDLQRQKRDHWRWALHGNYECDRDQHRELG